MLKGKGVPQNHKIAYILFNLAASKGNDNAVKNRDMALKN
jgi:TPR repeat protein